MNITITINITDATEEVVRLLSRLSGDKEPEVKSGFSYPVRTCANEYCKKEFVPNRRDAMYCSPKCRRKNHEVKDVVTPPVPEIKNEVIKPEPVTKQAVKNTSRKCEVCGKEFEPKTFKSKYCSESCAAKTYGRRYSLKKLEAQVKKPEPRKPIVEKPQPPAEEKVSTEIITVCCVCGKATLNDEIFCTSECEKVFTNEMKSSSRSMIEVFIAKGKTTMIDKNSDIRTQIIDNIENF